MMQQDTLTHIRSIDQRIVAIFEVLGVFLATFTLIWLAALLPIGQNERRFLNYFIMITFPLIILLVTRRDLKTYGLDFHPLRDHLNIALAVLPLVLIHSAIYG